MIGEITHAGSGISAQRAWRFLERNTPTATVVKPLSARELSAFTVGTILFLITQILISRPAILYDRSCWIDEYITQLLVSDPSVNHSVSAIRHGVETNPPGYIVIGRGVVRVMQAVAPVSVRVALRLFSTICVAGALVAAFALLRNSFATWPAVVGVLAVWPHPQLIEQLIEARPYAPMLVVSLLLAIALQTRGNSRNRAALRAIAVAGLAALLCTLHYFGLIVVAVQVMAAIFIDSGPMRRRIKRVAPAIAGALVLLPFLGYVSTQAAGLTRATFLVPFSPRSGREFLVDIFYPLPMLILLAGWGVGQLLHHNLPAPSHSRAARLRATVPLMSLAAVPLIILIFSALVQSALRTRYALVATFAVAPVAAMLVSSMRPRMIVAVAVPLVVMGAMQLVGTSRMRSEIQKITAAEASSFRQDAPSVPIVFADRGDAIELADLAPDLFDRIILMDERGIPSAQLNAQRRYDLEMMQKARPFYATPPLVVPQRLLNFDRLRIVANSDDLSRLLVETPMRRVGENLYEPIR